MFIRGVSQLIIDEAKNDPEIEVIDCEELPDDIWNNLIQQIQDKE